MYEVIQGYVFPLEDTPDFIAGRIAHAAERIHRAILPPFFRALRKLRGPPPVLLAHPRRTPAASRS